MAGKGQGKERQNRGWSQQRRQQWRPELLIRLQTCEAELLAEEEQLARVQTTEEEELAFVRNELQEEQQEVAAANFWSSLESSIWQDELREQVAESRCKAELLDASETRLTDLESEHLAESRSKTELLEASESRLTELELSETRLLRRESEWEELEDLECQRAEKHKASSQSERRKKMHCRDEELAESKEELAEEKQAKQAAVAKEEAATAEMQELRVELAASLLKLHVAESESAKSVVGVSIQIERISCHQSYFNHRKFSSERCLALPMRHQRCHRQDCMEVCNVRHDRMVCAKAPFFNPMGKVPQASLPGSNFHQAVQHNMLCAKVPFPPMMPPFPFLQAKGL